MLYKLLGLPLVFYFFPPTKVVAWGCIPFHKWVKKTVNYVYIWEPSVKADNKFMN